MFILREKTLRRIIREEFERFMHVPQKADEVISMKSAAGGEIIMPNYVRERFDSGQVTSIKDII